MNKLHYPQTFQEFFCALKKSARKQKTETSEIFSARETGKPDACTLTSSFFSFLASVGPLDAAPGELGLRLLLLLDSFEAWDADPGDLARSDPAMLVPPLLSLDGCLPGLRDFLCKNKSGEGACD